VAYEIGANARLWLGDKAGRPEDFTPYWLRKRSTLTLAEQIASLPGAVGVETPSWAIGPAER
jgi:hypothetical protein